MQPTETEVLNKVLQMTPLTRLSVFHAGTGRRCNLLVDDCLIIAYELGGLYFDTEGELVKGECAEVKPISSAHFGLFFGGIAFVYFVVYPAIVDFGLWLAK